MIRSAIPMSSEYDSAGRFFISLNEHRKPESRDDERVGFMSILRKIARVPLALCCRLGEYRATPLFAVLVVIETTDVLFAVDSIPAVLSISSDPGIAYTSNVFAILGLRALYFALAEAMARFQYLSLGLGACAAVLRRNVSREAAEEEVARGAIIFSAVIST